MLLHLTGLFVVAVPLVDGHFVLLGVDVKNDLAIERIALCRAVAIPILSNRSGFLSPGLGKSHIPLFRIPGDCDSHGIRHSTKRNKGPVILIDEGGYIRKGDGGVVNGYPNGRRIDCKKVGRDNDREEERKNPFHGSAPCCNFLLPI